MQGCFMDLKILIVPTIYILEVILCCIFLSNTSHNGDFHSYDKKEKRVYSSDEHRLKIYKPLPVPAKIFLFCLIDIQSQ